MKLKELVVELNNELKILQGMEGEIDDIEKEISEIIKPILDKYSNKFLMDSRVISYGLWRDEVMRCNIELKRDRRKTKSYYGILNSVEYYIDEPALKEIKISQLQVFMPLKEYLDDNKDEIEEMANLILELSK